jgi:hypothetical protein
MLFRIKTVYSMDAVAETPWTGSRRVLMRNNMDWLYGPFRAQKFFLSCYEAPWKARVSG